MIFLIRNSIFSAFLFFSSFCLIGQNRIIFQTIDGKPALPNPIYFYSAFGIRVLPMSIDSSNGIFDFKQYEVKKIECKDPRFELFQQFSNGNFFKGDTTIVLHDIVGLLDEIVVTANKTESKAVESNVSITSVKQSLISQKMTTESGNILDQVPGVNVIDNQVNIRSGSGWSYGAGSRVMVTLDGVPMLSGDANAVLFSFLPLENVQSIEVVKSAGSVLYGSSALNGVINFKTASPSHKPELKITNIVGLIDYHKRNSLKIDDRRHIQLNNNGYYSQRFMRTGVTFMWNGFFDEGYRLFEPTQRIRATLKLEQTFKRIYGLKVGLNSSYLQGKSGTFLLWRSDTFGTTPLDSAFAFNFSKRLSIDPYIYYQKRKFLFTFNGRHLTVNNHIVDIDTTTDQSNGSKFNYAEFKSTYFSGNRNRYTAGFVVNGASTRSPLYVGTNRSANFAMYAQGENRYKKLITTYGARYEFFKLNNKKFTQPVMRIGLNYQLKKYSYLRASFGQGYRFPSMAEAFISTSAGQVVVFPNANLKPESGNNIELGIKQGFKIGSYKAYLDVGIFQNRLKNMMEFIFSQWDANPNAPLFGTGFKNVNTGKAQIRGFEIETAGDGKIGNVKFTTLAGYTYCVPIALEPDTIFATDATGNKLSFANTRSDANNYLKYRYKHLIRFDLQATYKKVFCGLSIRYNSKMLNIDNALQGFPLEIFAPGVKQTRNIMGGKPIMDLRVGSNLNNSVNLSAQITNLFNTEYITRPADIRPPRIFQLQVIYLMQ